MSDRPVATLILNRNLPEVTDALVEHFQAHDGTVTDIYVIESGSLPERRSRYSSFVADWPDAMEHGLRFPRGFNFGLIELNKLRQYEYYFLVCQDALFPGRSTLGPMVDVMRELPLTGILSPASPHWGETESIPEGETRYFWFVNHVAWLFRGDLIRELSAGRAGTPEDYLYDGSNFRGYCTDIELVARTYVADRGVAITRRATFEEDVDLTERMAEEMRTDHRSEHRPAMLEEGMAWMRRKYGFTSRWQWITYVKAFYEEFFENHPDYAHLRI